MRKDKQLLLDEVKEQIDQYNSFVIMSYLKLGANAANKFRTEIANLGGNVEVMRKRVLIKAAEAAGVTLDIKALPGHIGLVFAGRDALETTKAVFKFSQDNNKAVEVIGARFEGQLYNGADMEMLSKLPGKDEMRAQLLATLEAPLSQTLAVMDAVLTSVVYCLDNKCKQQGSENN